jgi:hypothetical protein
MAGSHGMHGTGGTSTGVTADTTGDTTDTTGGTTDTTTSLYQDLLGDEELGLEETTEDVEGEEITGFKTTDLEQAAADGALDTYTDLDSDGDGTVSEDEVTTADADGDGIITEEELSLLIEKMLIEKIKKKRRKNLKIKIKMKTTTKNLEMMTTKTKNLEMMTTKTKNLKIKMKMNKQILNKGYSFLYTTFIKPCFKNKALFYY